MFQDTTDNSRGSLLKFPFVFAGLRAWHSGCIMPCGTISRLHSSRNTHPA